MKQWHWIENRMHAHMRFYILNIVINIILRSNEEIEYVTNIAYSYFKDVNTSLNIYNTLTSLEINMKQIERLRVS